MTTELLDIHNCHQRCKGVMDCLSDGFGPILVDEEAAAQILLSKIRSGHFIVKTIVDDQVVSTATGIIEMKLIHAGDPKYASVQGPSYVLGIEDVATRTGQRGHGYGAAAVKALHEIAKEEDCYKIILDCSVNNFENFYNKMGYVESELCVRKNM
jgi:glucosamine-phosphate N-acetyltransferase